MDTNNNIFFTVEDNLNENTTNIANIDEMMSKLLGDDDDDEYGFDYNDYSYDDTEQLLKQEFSLAYFKEKSMYHGVPEAYYNTHTIKELMKICHYYDLAKNVKGAKCKKADIVATVVFFEAQPENKEIVNKRNNMWAYMRELANDQKMKPYLIWT